MKKFRDKRLDILVGFAVFIFMASAYSSDNFVKVKLPKGVSIELPNDWIVLSNDKRISLDTMVESGLDLAV